MLFVHPDIDMIPLRNMDLSIEGFLERAENDERGACENCAYVIPTYEIDSDSPEILPANKRELVENYLKVNE